LGTIAAKRQIAELSISAFSLHTSNFVKEAPLSESISSFTVQRSSFLGRTPLKVWIGLALAVALDVPVQLLWKALMLKYGDAAHGPRLIDLFHQFRWFAHQSRTWVLLGFFLCQFVNWMWVLGNADLSYAQPFTALSYVAVSGCAAFYFHEHLSPLRITGIALILLGVIFVGSSLHRTTPTHIAAPV
jgi:drug/metabolite transporter (DMT)-like permease